MELHNGYLYFVKDDFFDFVNDKYLKKNYKTTKRPHYFAFKNLENNLLWLVPCSCKIEKYEKIIQDKKAKGKPTDIIKIVTIFNNKEALLFQDMYPVTEKYISEPYIKGNQYVHISNPKLIKELEKNANKIIKLIRRGIKFTPTQPDALRIEKLLLQELQKEKHKSIIETAKSNLKISSTTGTEE